MRNQTSLMIRYAGTDYNRKFLIQRGDGWFWTGKAFSPREGDAEVYDDKHQCQLTRHVLRSSEYRGKPMRTFKFVVTMAMVGDEVDAIDLQELTDFLMKAANLNLDAGAHGEGPRDTILDLFMSFRTLVETKSPRELY